MTTPMDSMDIISRQDEQLGYCFKSNYLFLTVYLIIPIYMSNIPNCMSNIPNCMFNLFQVYRNL